MGRLNSTTRESERKMGPRVPPRDLDRLRALSPISRPAKMNSRTPVILHAPRSGASSSIAGGPSTPVSAFNPGHRSQSARVIRQPHAANINNNNNRKPGTPHIAKAVAKRKQLNTAFYASPRKTSAPSKLINALGGSLDSLPSTVSVRRKVSTPAKALNSTISSASSQG